jgi:hypothetical protein
MNFKKSKLLEIIDSNGDLIGKNDTPEVDANADTQANNTTDYNAKIGTQPFRYDMLGRFGFSLLPFFEGKENQGQQELLDELTGLMHQRFAETLEYYYRNPNKLKSDFRKSREEGHGHDDECEKKDIEWAKKIIKAIQPHFEKAFKEPIEESSSINEDKIIEDNMVEDHVIEKRTEDEISNKSEDKEIKDSKLRKIAGLINKLDQHDINKLKNLLETK